MDTYQGMQLFHVVHLLASLCTFISDYLVLSEFTLALFEDSGWYKANYTALNNLKQNPLQWGKSKYLNCSYSCHL